MNSIKQIEELASRWSDDTRVQVASRYKKAQARSQADADEWFISWRDKYCTESFDSPVTCDGSIVYKLVDGCVFDRNHKDAAIVIRDDGKIGYNCFHNTCKDRQWKDFRLLYEPDAYQRNTAWQ